MRKLQKMTAGTCGILAVITMLIATSTFATEQPAWNGYLQLRASDDYRSEYGYAVRRAQVWVSAPAPFAPDWSYKIQGMFRYQNKGAFSLQDAYAVYHVSAMEFRLGQQTPDYCLQRQQPDAEIPFVERTPVADALIPSAESDGRDIGLDVQWNAINRSWHWSAGAFNGNGGNTGSSGGKHLMAVSRMMYTATLGKNISWENGMSAAYRDVNSANFTRISGAGVPYTGSDFRAGVESHMSKDSLWDFQAEFLQARLNSRKAWGGYGYGAFYVTRKDLIALDYDYYHDLSPISLDMRAVDISWSHFLAGHKAKFMLDNRVERAGDQTHFLTAGQFQLFLH